MERSQIKELVAKYNEGLADPSEVKVIEQLLESGEVQLTELRELSALELQLEEAMGPVPSMQLDDRFQTMLSAEMKKIEKPGTILIDWSKYLAQLPLAAGLILVGFFIGNRFQGPASQPEVQALTQQVADLKEMMMLTLLEKESASERLKAVSLTDEMDRVSDKVTSALFKTLNGDPNVNVRLAALDAIRPYTKDNHVRQELVNSIVLQESPLVQVTLADLMVAIQEKQSVTALKKILENDKTPQDVKKKIRKSIEVLI